MLVRPPAIYWTAGGGLRTFKVNVAVLEVGQLLLMVTTNEYRTAAVESVGEKVNVEAVRSVNELAFGVDKNVAVTGSP